ncbi:MAG: MBL fold metallo-hydrolase [Candidatus Melainabacteria bacterium]|nr:MAG: MBL fold metallo-hydrolase [Candidatus Melainabacteria bacterium]
MTKQEQKRVARTGQPLLKLHVLGAAGAVTGSLNLFEYIERDRVTRFLVDVGLTVEDERADFMNRLPVGIKPSDIDFIIISHAHIDHSGYLPKLVKDGFKGPAYLTPASSDLLQFMLPDSGFLQEEAVKRANARNRKNLPATEGGASDGVKARGNVPQRQPLYTQEHAKQSLQHLRTIPYNERRELAPNVAVTFTDAGHILGSAVVNLEIGSGSSKRTFCFSGNIGRYDMPLLSELESVRSADYVMVESTYGNKLHNRRDRFPVLADIINRAHVRALEKHPKFGCGVIMIPAFAVGRAQVIMHDLRQLMAEGRIPQMPVFIDSPMTIRSTEVHRKYRDAYNPLMRALFDAEVDPFTTPEQTLCHDWKESVALLEPQSKPIIIIGSSGMASGGRIVQHLQHRLPARQSTVVFVGYQGTGTLGQTLVGGLREGNPDARPTSVRISGKDVRVNAAIEFMPDYSAHADYGDTIRWLRGFQRRPRSIFLVHGDTDALEGLEGHIKNSLGWNVVVPKAKQEFVL